MNLETVRLAVALASQKESAIHSDPPRAVLLTVVNDGEGTTCENPRFKHWGSLVTLYPYRVSFYLSRGFSFLCVLGRKGQSAPGVLVGGIGEVFADLLQILDDAIEVASAHVPKGHRGIRPLDGQLDLFVSAPGGAVFPASVGDFSGDLHCVFLVGGFSSCEQVRSPSRQAGRVRR